MENEHKYQDTLVFTNITRSIITHLDSNTDIRTRLPPVCQISIKPLCLILILPAALETDAVELYGYAAKIELLALSLYLTLYRQSRVNLKYDLGTINKF